MTRLAKKPPTIAISQHRISRRAPMILDLSLIFFAFSPISTASRASLSALRRLWFAWNSGSAWLSDIVCLDESGWRARRSSSSATCCSADRFGLIIYFFPSFRALLGGGWHRTASGGVRDLPLTVAGLALDGIDFATWLRWLHHDRVACSTAGRARVLFDLLCHIEPFMRPDWRPCGTVKQFCLTVFAKRPRSGKPDRQ